MTPSMDDLNRILKEDYQPALEQQLNKELFIQSQFQRSWAPGKITRRTRLRFWFRRLEPLTRFKSAYRAFKDPYYYD